MAWWISSRRPPRPTAAGNAPRTLTRREFLRLASAASAGLVLGGCGWGGGETKSTAEETVQLVYQDWRTDWYLPMARRELDYYNRKHPDVRVFFTPDPENLEERMLQDMQAGTAADVFQGCCAHFPTWAQQGYTLDLAALVERDWDELNVPDWDPGQYQAFFLPNGLQFGVPKYHGALALFYNKDVFDERGVDYPDFSWDYDDYLGAMRQLAGRRDAAGIPSIWGGMVDFSWDRLQVHINAFGGHLVDPLDPLRSGLDDPRSMAAIEWLRAAVWDERVMPSPTEVHNLYTREAFASGLVATCEDGSWALRDILETADFRVGVAPLPLGPARRVTLASSDGFGIFSGSNHPEEAWELVKFLVSPRFGRALSQSQLLQPARVSLLDEWDKDVRSAYPEQDLDLRAFTRGQTEGWAVTAEIFPADMAEALRLAQAAWEQILILGQSDVSMLEQVDRDIEAAQRAAAGGSAAALGREPNEPKLNQLRYG